MLPTLLLSQLPDLLDSQTLAKGLDYFKAKRVSALKVATGADGELEIDAKVKGSSWFQYSVQINYFDQDEWFSDCSCPVGVNCKHVAATLYAYTAQQKPSKETLEQQQLDAWKQEVDAALSRLQTETALAESILYLLSPEQHRTRVSIKRVRLKKDGGWGKPAPHKIGAEDYHYHRPSYIHDSDVEVLFFLRQHREFLAFRSDELILKSSAGAHALTAMLKSGRCHWLSPENPPLTAGAPLPIEPQWLSLRGQQQQLKLTDKDGPLIAVAPPAWLDLKTHSVHRLESELAPALLEVMAMAPALSDEQLLQQADLLQRLAPTLPTPRIDPNALRNDIMPRPVLQLQAMAAPAEMSWLPTGTRLRFARLQFDYEGNRVEHHDSRATIHATVNGASIKVRRQSALEMRARAQLTGMLPITSAWPSMPHRLMPANAFSFTVPKDWLAFFQTTLVELRQSDWLIECAEDAALRIDAVEELSINIVEPKNSDWFDVSIEFRDGKKIVDLIPLLRLHEKQILGAADHETLMLIMPGDADHVWTIAAARAKQIVSTLTDLFDDSGSTNGKLRLSRFQALSLTELSIDDWQGGKRLRAAADKLRAGPPASQPPPESFKAQLRPYQQQGVDWLQFLRDCDLNGILADDMGLGKTVQTLAHICIEKDQNRLKKPCLVICPTSLVANWHHEAQHFAPHLQVLVLSGSKRHALFPHIKKSDLVITTYPLLVRDIELLKEYQWHLLTLDEAQTIKNPRSTAAEYVRLLQTNHRLCLTGTPMENHLGELWALMDFLLPGLLGNEKAFRKQFRKPIEQDGDDERRKVLQRRIAPFLMRRRKDEVVKELPDKVHILRTLALAPKQADLYESVRVAMQEKVQQEIAKRGLNRSHIIVLDALLKLRQVCCDPRLVKLPTAKTVKDSAKLDFLMELLPSLIDEGRRILLFSQFTEMLALIEEELQKQEIPYVQLTGSTRDRETPIRQFQQGEVPLFLISLKAGGVGLNLTAADTVIHYDPWWNPAVENQATDRAHRIGQDKTVFVYKLIAENSLEEKILVLQQRKQNLADGLYDSNKGIESAFNTEDIEMLLSPL